VIAVPSDAEILFVVGSKRIVRLDIIRLPAIALYPSIGDLLASRPFGRIESNRFT
jgi:hypothetical protein